MWLAYRHSGLGYWFEFKLLILNRTYQIFRIALRDSAASDALWIVRKFCLVLSVYSLAIFPSIFQFPILKCAYFNWICLILFWLCFDFVFRCLCLESFTFQFEIDFRACCSWILQFFFSLCLFRGTVCLTPLTVSMFCKLQLSSQFRLQCQLSV